MSFFEETVQNLVEEADVRSQEAQKRVTARNQARQRARQFAGRPTQSLQQLGGKNSFKKDGRSAPE